MYKSPIPKVLIALAAIVASQKSFADAKNVAVIYRGPGVCKDGCVKAVSDLAARNNVLTRSINAKSIEESTFKNARVWIHPGGDAVKAAQAISPESKKLILQFVAAGGGYLGFCAGGFLADSTVDDGNLIEGLGILPGRTLDYTDQKAPQILPILWGKSHRYVYFEEGPVFEMSPHFKYQVLGRYRDGRIAIVQFKYGAGNVVLSGVHPEAPESWRTFDDLEDPDGLDYDIADDLLQRALGQGTAVIK